MSAEATTITEEKKSRKGIGGPNTREGKERTKLNALKTGLHARSVAGMRALSDVVGVTFESVLEQARAHYQPADFIEETLVRRIARCAWKLMVLESIEDHRLEFMRVGQTPGTSLEKLSIIERRTDVQLHRAIAALNAKRKAEHENVKNGLRAEREPSARALKAAFRERPDLTYLDLAKSPNHPLAPDPRTPAPVFRNPSTHIPVQQEVASRVPNSQPLAPGPSPGVSYP